MDKDAFMKEARVMHSLRHRKLVQLMGICTKCDPFFIIIEFMEKGPLRDYLMKENINLSFQNLIDFAAQV